MKRALFVPLLFATALAGCAEPDADIAVVDPGKQITVERVRVQFAPAYSPGVSDLPVVETRRLQTFLDHARMRPNDRAYVAASDGDPLAAARIAKLSALLARRGIGTERVPAPAGGVQPNHLMLMVDRYVATPPACPDWSGSPATPHFNTPSANFGCATQTNLSLMVDNPRDILIGRNLGPADAEPAIDSVRRYREGKVKPLLAGPQSSSGGAGGSSSGMGASSGGGGAPGGQ
jgi:pilus assembly protein CpaD